METCVALFRGINVGGKNTLPMKELVALLERLGCRSVKTYIQSGNAIFRIDAVGRTGLSRRIGDAVRKNHGFEPRVLLLKPADLERAMAANPFPEADAKPKSLHVFFLDGVPPNPDLGALRALKKGSERFHLEGGCFYLHAPEGIGRSRLAARVEKSLGVAATARNWQTVGNILKLADQLD